MSSERAVDGDIDSDFISGSCTLTKEETSPWWRVDLGTMHSIGSVRIFNRGDCCGHALNKFIVEVGENDKVGVNRVCGREKSMTTGGNTLVTCQQSHFGRYVFIRSLMP